MHNNFAKDVNQQNQVVMTPVKIALTWYSLFLYSAICVTICRSVTII